MQNFKVAVRKLKFPNSSIEYSNEKFYNKLSLAVKEAEERPVAMLQTLRIFSALIIKIIALLSILVYLDWVTIIIAVLGMFVTVWGNVVNDKTGYRYDVEENKIKRFFDYVKRIFYLPQYKDDVHFTNISEVLIEKYKEKNEAFNGIIKTYMRPIAFVAVTASWLFNFAIYGLGSLWGIRKVFKGSMGAGDFTSVIFAIEILSDNLLQFSRIFTDLKKHSLYVQNFIDVMEYSSAIYIGLVRKLG